MKQLLLFVLLVAICIPKLKAQGSNKTKIEQVKALVVATEEGMKSILPDTPDAVAENIQLLRKIPEFRTLESDMNDYWKPIANNLPSIAPTETSQVILVQACANMTPENYIKFLNEMALACEQKAISKTMLQRAMSPDGRLEYILADNYQNKDVIAFCERAKKIWAADPQMVNMFSFILSGETKRGVDGMRKDGGGAPPEVKIGPSASPTTSGTGSQ